MYKIDQKSKVHFANEYFCELIPTIKDMTADWKWRIVTYNGHTIMISHSYFNKAQCRNVGKKFANCYQIDWRE